MKQLFFLCDINRIGNTESFSAVLEQYFSHWHVMIYRLGCCHPVLMKYCGLCNNLIGNVT